MPFITFLCLIIFVCLLLGNDGFKIMGIALAIGALLGVILFYIGNAMNERKKSQRRAEHRKRLGLDD